MSNKQDDIYSLIKRLTKNEKRFFKIFSERHQTKGEELQYIKLFNVYDQIDDYNAAEFLILIQEKKIGANIRYLKHQLYKQILRSLNVYNYEKSTEFEIQNLLINTTILFEKGLLKQAQKLLTQAKKIAKENDFPLLLIKCYEKEKEIAREQFNKELITFHANELPKIEAENLEKYKTFSLLTQMRSKLMLSAILGDEEFDEKSATEIKNINDNLYKIEKTDNNNFAVNDTIYVIKSLISIYRKDFNGTLKHLKERDILYSNNPKQITNNQTQYIALQYNLLVTYFKLKSYNEGEKILSIFNAFRLNKNTRLVDIKLFNYLNIELDYYNIKGDFKKTATYKEQILKGLRKYTLSIHDLAKAALFTYLSIAFLSLKKYEESTFFASKVLDDLSLDDFSEQKITAFIIVLINAFEQKKYVYLNYLSQQIETDSIILSFFSSTNFNTLSKKEIKDHLIEFKIVLEESQTELEGFDILTWVKAQIINQPFDYLVKLKFSSENL